MPAPATVPVRPVPSWSVVLAAICLGASLLAVGPVRAAEAPAQDRLADVRSRIGSTLAQLDDVASRAQESEEALAAAEATVAQLEAELNEVLEEVLAQERRVEAARAESEAATAERERVEALAADRARRAFMGGGVSTDLVFLRETSDDLGGVLDRLAYLDAIAARESAAIESLDVVRTVADAAAERLGLELQRLEEARTTREELLDQAEVVFAERADALASLQGQQERLLAQRERLESEEADLQALVRRQEEAARRGAGGAAGGQSGGSGGSGGGSATPPPPPSSGCYQWPAGGAVTSEYGPRWGRLHAGLDIDGNTGDSIVAAQSGTVTFAGWYSGYGRMTMIQHGDGVTTAYAHQSSSSVSVGQTVARGQYIGAIGTTGNVTGSHLHFETRTGSGAVNPRTYLC